MKNIRSFEDYTPLIDVSAFIDYLLQKGIMSKNEYITCLELGNEVTSGSGSTVIRDYEIKLTDR